MDGLEQALCCRWKQLHNQKLQIGQPGMVASIPGDLCAILGHLPVAIPGAGACSTQITIPFVRKGS